MNIKFKTIAAAAIMAAVSATASATISTGNSTNPSPDLLFLAWDGTTGASYVRDLGPLTSTTLASSTSFAAPAASIFASTFASTDPTTIQWNVVAFSTQSIQVYTTGDGSQYGTGVTHAQVLQAGGNETATLGGLTQLDNPANKYAFANGEYTGSTDLNNQTNASEVAFKASFGQPVEGQGVGASQNFLEFDTTGKLTQLYLNSKASAFDNNQPGGYFTLTDAQGDLTWTNPASVSSVPLPGAALLFLPGLLGMIGIGRRNKKLAA